METDHNGQNVRVFGNYFKKCFVAVSHQTVALGPTYVTHNIVGEALQINTLNSLFMKVGSVNPAHKSRLYVMHNTTLNANGQGVDIAISPVAGRYGDYYVYNNLFQALNYAMWLYPSPDTINDSDYNLYDSPFQILYGLNDQNAAPHFSAGSPWIYHSNGTVDARVYTTPGKDEGVNLNGFNSGYLKTGAIIQKGIAADKGAAEHGRALFEAGVTSQSFWEN